MSIDELIKKLNELVLQVQILEKRVEELESGSFGTGIYLDGCNEVTKNYLNNDSKEKKEGE
jgi:hypothetical protein